MLPKKPSSQRIFLVVAGLILIGVGIGLRDPWPSDEPRFALISREMVRSGEWLFPRRGGELYPDKPPLFFWIQSLFLWVTGSMRVAFLLPSLLAGIGVLLLVHDMGRRLWSARVGFHAALLLLLSPQFLLQTRSGRIDALECFWVALGMYAFLRHLLLGPSLGWLYAGFVACGLGIMTKGVGFLPLFVFVPALVLRLRGRPLAVGSPGQSGGRQRAGGVALHGLLGVATMLGVLALWLVPMLLAVAHTADPAYEAYRDNILFHQTGERYAAPSHHVQPAWYFIAEVIPGRWLPIFVLLPWLVPAWWRRIRRGDPRPALLLGFAVLGITFFSLSPGKRGVYVLPMLPWVALAAGPMLGALARKRPVQRIALAVTWVLGLGFLAAAIVLSVVGPERFVELHALYPIEPRPVLLGIGAVIVAVAVGLRARGILAFSLATGVLWVGTGLFVYPMLDGIRSGRNLMTRVEELLGPDTPLGLVAWKEQTLLQARRPTVNFGFLVDLEEQERAGVRWLMEHPDGRLLVQGRAMEPCFDEKRSELVGRAHRRDWYLVGPEAVRPACREASGQ